MARATTKKARNPKSEIRKGSSIQRSSLGFRFPNSARAWLGIVAGVALAHSGAAEASLPPVLAGLTGALAQTPARPVRAHAALNSGVESYRKADYESAALYIAQAQASQDDLSLQEREELAALIRLNSDALKQRQEGRKRLHDAELAATDGRTAEAEALLKSIANNQFLSTDDKLKVQKLYEILSPGTGVPSPTMPNQDSSAVIARTKLQQARTMLAHGDYDAADHLVLEVEGMHVRFTEREDSPRKVRDDVARARAAMPKDAKGMLTAGRTALGKGDLENAERLAHEAEKAAGPFTFSGPWSDSPKKLLNDVQLARVRLALEGAQHDAQAQKMAGQGQKGVPQAKQNQLVSESRMDSTTKSGNPAPMTLPTDPHDLLKLGRDLYMSNNLDESEKMAQRAKEAGGSWGGLFKDSPDKLINDIKKARKEESVRVLAEAHRLYEQGQYEEAKAKAQRAETLHGPSYSILERDRPLKLVTEIEAAQAKAQSQAKAPPKDKVLPPMPMLDVSSELKNSTPGTAVKAPNNSSMLVKPSMPSAPSMPSSTPATIPGGYQIPDDSQVAGMNKPAPSNPMVDMPRKENNMAGPSTLGGMQNQTADRRGPSETSRPSAPIENPNKPQAKRLLAEARQQQLAGNLVEARQKVLEAQRLNVQFSVDEERPEIVLLQLTESAKKQVDALCQQATDYTLTADREGKRYKMAEEALVSARRLAAGFALDTQPVDVKMAWVRQTIDHNQGGAPPVLQVQHQEASDIPSPPSGLNMPIGPQVSKVTVSAAPPAGAPAAVVSAPAASAPPAEDSYPLGGLRQDGQALLDKAREELRKGDTDGARRLAVEAFNGPYGVRDQADAVIHSIDAEEISQKSLAANRSYEAGVTAYQRRDYALAGNIFQSVDVVLLPPEKQAKLRELLQMPEMQMRVTQTGLKGGMTTSETTAGAARVSDSDNKPKRAPLEESYSQQVQALQEVQFQKLRDEGLRVQREAMDRAQAGETDRAIQLLENYLEGLKGAQLESQKLALLRRPVESRLQNFKTLKAQQDFEMARSGDKKSFVELRESQAKAEQHKQQLVAEQMKKYHAAYKEGRYAEAETFAMKAHELDPDNTQASAAMEIAHMARNLAKTKDIEKRREDMVYTQLEEAEDEGTVVNGEKPLAYDQKRWMAAKDRKEIQPTILRNKNEKDREIESKMIYPLSLNFKNTPFRQVVEDLRTWTGINIVVDKRALEEDNISMDQPVEMNLNGVMLKSALAEILHQMRLTYVIENECLNITTEAHAKGRLVLKTYQVADLVIPIEDHTTPTVAAMLGMQEGSAESRALSTPGTTPFTSQHSLPNGQSVSGSLNNQQNPSSPAAATSTQPPKKTLEDSLIKLITNTIKPDSWDSMGGPGTIDYFPLGMALTINQTPDIQEQVQELLHALRRLQDMEVAIEIRFISISEAFFERIGLDFNINIVTNNPKFENMIVSQQFAPFGQINKIHSDAVVGLQPTGTFTNTLDIPIGSGNSFQLAAPPFGGFPTMPGADGGLSLGLAFLSDIQVFLFMEAAQGDRRTNVMQAPKLTLQNAQTSTINVTDLQFFVTNVSFFLVNGQVVFVPTNTPIPTGVMLTMNAVVTADRRFVRMSLAPTLTNLATPVTALFPVTTFVTPLFEGGAQGQPVPFTMFLQQPGFTTVTTNTTVMVPDGGTVLMGGLKTLREGRNEFGPPILSKLPYINRLFKNVGYGRETESLLMMVTPRIIINEEEEAKQTGVGPGLGDRGAEAAQ